MSKIRLFFSKVLVFFVRRCISLYENAYQYKLYSRFKSIGKNAVIELPTSVLGEEFITIGDNFIARKDSKIRAYSDFEGYQYRPEIIIGDDFYMGTNCCISAIGKIKIGNSVTFASNITVLDHQHGLSDFSDIETPVMKRELSSKGAIVIEDNVWLGEGSVVLSGVIIGKNCIVGANAVVTKSFPANCVIAGVPAKVVKTF
jgi:acetyltransferase-like isoleucine patch superfamily enzyme